MNNQSAPINLYKKLLKIQQNTRGLGKDSSANGYKYVSGSKVLDHIKPLMNDMGVLLIQEVLSLDNERMDYSVSSGKEKSEILTRVSMKFTWIDVESGERLECLFAANGQNGWDKGLGSALTYAERYFLLKFFHVSTDEDDIDNPNRKPDSDEGGKPKKQKEGDKPKLLLTDADVDAIRQVLSAAAGNAAKVKEGIAALPTTARQLYAAKVKVAAKETTVEKVMALVDLEQRAVEFLKEPA